MGVFLHIEYKNLPTNNDTKKSFCHVSVYFFFLSVNKKVIKAGYQPNKFLRGQWPSSKQVSKRSLLERIWNDVSPQLDSLHIQVLSHLRLGTDGHVGLPGVIIPGPRAGGLTVTSGRVASLGELSESAGEHVKQCQVFVVVSWNLGVVTEGGIDRMLNLASKLGQIGPK